MFRSHSTVRSDASNSRGLHDDGLANSEVESDSSSSDGHRGPKDYWFGKQYFQCVLAQEVLHQTSVDASIPLVESQLDVAIHNYPYQDCLRTLQQQGLGRRDLDSLVEPGSIQVELFSLLGYTVRTGKAQERQVLVAALRRFSDGVDRIPTSRSTTSGPPLFAEAKDEMSGGIKLPNLGSESPEIARYSIALRDWAMNRGQKVEPVVEQTNLDPPQYQASIELCGRVFIGTARQKKLAKHEAAKEACRNLVVSL